MRKQHKVQLKIQVFDEFVQLHPKLTLGQLREARLIENNKETKN